MLPFFLQGLDSDIEPRQSDIVVKIEPITDLLIDVLAPSGSRSSLALLAFAIR